ncbi:MAG: hypothetical protein HY287_16115 [Planctomycetes bacterium]|nr:hypothetical protein [Planctomycetota bacterium]
MNRTRMNALLYQRGPRGHRLKQYAVVLALYVLVSPYVMAQCEQLELHSPEAGSTDFAYAIDIDSVSGVAVFGAPRDSDRGTNAGAAYVYRRAGNNWQLEQKLLASDGKPDDLFGTSVAVSGNVLVVGAPQIYNGGYGIAYVFTFDGALWIETSQLTPTLQAHQEFGYSVDIEADLIVVSSPQAGNDYATGLITIFRQSGTSWTRQAVVPSPTPGANFGLSVSTSQGRILVGAYSDSEDCSFCGAAYVYRWSGSDWVNEARLTSPSAHHDDLFGIAVALDSGVAIVGTPTDPTFGDHNSRASMFQFAGSDWTFTQDLLPPDRWIFRHSLGA